MSDQETSFSIHDDRPDVLSRFDGTAGGSKAKRGQADDPQNTDFLAFTSTGGGGGTAGMVLEVAASIEGMGQSVINVDSSWHWSPGPYETGRHQCALVDQVPSPVLPDALTGDPIVYASEVRITAANGDQVVGNIQGGSVCELVVFAPAESINQWLIAFEVSGDDSTGRFAGRSGQGVIDFKYNSMTFSFEQPFQLSLNLD